MKMRKQISLLLGLLLMIISITAFVSAGAVQLEVITYANHDVTVNILDPVREDPLLMTLEDNTGQDAKVEFNFEATASKIDIWVGVKKSGKLVTSKKFTGYTPSGPISLRVLKDDPLAVNTTNQTANSTNQTTNTTTNNVTNQTSPNTTSSATPATNTSSTEPTNETSEDSMPKYFSDFPVMKVIIYIVAILAVVLIIVGVILFLVFRNKSKAPKDIKVKKYSELKEEIKERNKTADEKKIDELENRIKGLQDEVDDIKNKKSRIKEVEERIKKDMVELERLKK